MRFAENEPFGGKSFKGRIAYSADGNYNDATDVERMGWTLDENGSPTARAAKSHSTFAAPPIDSRVGLPRT